MVLNQIQDGREVVIAFASRSLRLSQRRYCTTRREMLAAVVMCALFRSYLRGAQFTLHTDHSSLRWLQFRNKDGMLSRWYLLLGQCIVRRLSMPMRMVCPANAASVRGRIVRFLRLTRRWQIVMSPRCWRSSPWPPLRWVSPLTAGIVG